MGTDEREYFQGSEEFLPGDIGKRPPRRPAATPPLEGILRSLRAPVVKNLNSTAFSSAVSLPSSNAVVVKI
jgi:hypothetical protein